MRQAEIQVGGVYVSKGFGMREGKRVKLVRIIPGNEDQAPRVRLEPLDGGKPSSPRVSSFQNAYAVEQLPQAVTDVKKMTAPRAQEATPSRPETPPRGLTREQVAQDLEQVVGAFRLGLEALERVVGKLEGRE